MGSRLRCGVGCHRARKKEREGGGQSGWGGDRGIKRKCGIHEDLETLFRATSSMWSRSMTPGWTRYSRNDESPSFPCIS